MINTNCSFQKFNDLMGIHKVIFDSLIDGRSLSESVVDVKSRYLQHYYGNDLRGLGSDTETIKNMLSDVASAIFLATKLVDQANDIEEVTNKFDVTDAESVINRIVGEWQAQLLSNAGVLATSNVESRTPEEEMESTMTTGVLTTPTIHDTIISANIIAEPLIVDVQSIKTPTDLTYNYFKAATIAKNKLTRTLFNDLFKASFIDLSDPKALPVRTTKEVDTNVKKYKSRLFATLFPNQDLYIDGVTRPDFDAKLKDFEFQLKQMNNGNGVYVQDILRWTIYDTRELKQYHAFITLKHFDDLIKMYGKGLVKVKTNLVGNYAEVLEDLKYLPATTSNMRTGYTNEEIISAAQETTEIFRTFVETTPIINLEGNRTGNFLKPDQVYYSLSKLKGKIDKSDVTTSVKNAIVDAIEKFFNGTNKDLNNSDIKTLLSLYQRVFMDKAQNKHWKKNPNLVDIVSNLEAIKENSLAMVYKTHYPGRHNINLLEVISSAINKVDLMNYGEVSYDFSTKEFKSISLQNKLNDRNFNIIKALGSQSLNATEQSIQNWRDTLSIDVDDESVSFNIGNRTIRYDVLEQLFTDKDGEEFDFNSVKTPLTMLDLSAEAVANDHQEYKTILETVSTITGQPLTSQNYEIPQILSDNFGKEHIKNLLTMAGNFVYTSNLKANYLADIENMSNADIKYALDSVSGLTSRFPFKTLWNSNSGYFNLDFNALAFQAIRNYADVLNEVYGSNIKSTTVNAQGNAIPTYTLSRMINDFNSVVKLMRNSEYNTEMPLAHNMFIANIEDDLLKKVEVRLNLKDSQGNIVSSSGLSDIENVSYGIFNDYLEQKLAANELDRNPKFQPTNYADKSSHAAIVINGNAQLEIDGVTKRYRDFKADDFKKHFFFTQKSYFDNTWKTLQSDYRTLFESGALHKRYLSNSSILSTAIGMSDFEGLIDYKALPEFYQGDKLKQEVKTYNDLFKVNRSFLLGEGGNTDFNIDDTNEIIGKVNEKTLHQALSDAGVTIIKTLSYEVDPSTKKSVINRTLKYMADNFDSGADAYQDKLKRNFLKSLEDIGFTLDYLTGDSLTENPLLMRAAKQWDLAKFKDAAKGRFKLYNGSLKGKDKFIMNPILEQYLWEYNMNTQNFQNATVGSILGHPAKVKKGDKETETAFQDKMVSARSIAMFKRMVIHQATFHPYNLNLINGIPFYGKVAFIKDPSSEVFAPYGLKASVDVTDGSTYNLMLLTELQNNSLLDQRAGVTQKSIGGGLNHKYNSAELLKHAAHSITNERLNSENADSKFSWMNLVKKGLNQPFAINQIGVKLDISKDFNGKEIVLTDSFSDVAFYEPIMKQYLAVQKIEPSPNWMSNNEYNIYYKDLVTGETLDPKAVQIETLYQLWEALGGKNSISFVEGEYDATTNLPEHLKSYTPSNRSWEALAEFVNRVGVWYDDKAIEAIIPVDSAIPFTANDIKEAHNSRTMSPYSVTKNFGPKTSSPNQKTVIQPLKQSFIGQFTFSSGQKVGVQNENDTNVIEKGNESPLKFAANISNMHTGLQLNADHETDDSHVTEPTQITNTLPFNGDTPEYPRKAFKAIYQYIDNSLSKLLPDIDSMLVVPSAKLRIYNLLVNEIVRGLEGKDLTNMAGAIAISVKKELDTYKDEIKQIVQLDPTNPVFSTALSKLESLTDEGFKLPFSDSNIYSSFGTTVANFFTKNGIRRKLPGSAAVISPYSGFAGVRTVIDPVTNTASLVNEAGYNAWKTKVIQAGLDPASFETTPITLENKDLVEIFDTVVDSNGKKTYLDTPDKYYAFKANPNEFTKLNLASRDLKPTMHKWSIEGLEGTTNYYDLPITKLSFLNGQLQEALDKLFSVTKGKRRGNLSDDGKSAYELEKEGSNASNYENAVANLTALMTEHNNLVDYAGLSLEIPQYKVMSSSNGETFEFVLLENGKPTANTKVGFNDKMQRLLKNDLTQMLTQIYKNKRAPMPITSLGIPGALGKYKILVDFEDDTQTVSAQQHYADYVERYPGTTIEQWYTAVQPMVRVDNLTTVPGEIMMPPIFKTKYGITANHNVSDITKEFFVDRLNSNALPHTVHHDLYVRSPAGEHLYVLVNDSRNHQSLDLREVKIDTNSVRQEDGSIKTFKLDEDGNPQYELGYDKLYQSMIDGKMHNFVVVNDIDELKRLKVITGGSNSTYRDIIPNFQAGVSIATLGVEYLKFAGDKYADKFDSSLKMINNAVNSTSRLKTAQDVIEAKTNQEVLLSLYDQAWVDDQLQSIREAIALGKLDADQQVRAKDRLKYLEEYHQALAENASVQDETTRDSVVTKAAAFRNQAAKKAQEQIRNLTASLAQGESDIDNALREMDNFIHNDIVTRNEKYAADMYASFIVQLNVTAARIPGQHMQSYMGQTVVGFIHSEENLAFVSPFHMWITGEDFDIDKAYISQYSVDDNGKLIGWSKMFNYTSPETLTKSLELPIPDKSTKNFITDLQQDTTFLGSTLNNNDALNILGYLKTKANFPAYVDSMKKLEEAEVYLKDIEPDLIQPLKDHINSYFLSEMNARFPKEAALNALVSAINYASNDIRNVNAVYSPISFGEAGEAAARSKKGQGFNTVSPFNPVDIAKATNNNMIGREVIGISASTGLKGYSALSNAFIKIMKGPLDIPVANVIYDYITDDKGNVTRTNERLSVGIAGINYTNSVDEFMNYYTSVLEHFKESEHIPAALLEVDLAQVRANVIEQLRYRGDVALDLSAILSAATDNAKELILARINAGPETVTFYLAGLMYGYNFESLSNLMTSKEAEAMINLASRNLFTGKKVSLASSLSQLKAGVLKPRDYFSFKAMQVIVDQLKKNPEIVKAVLKTFGEHLEPASIAKALKNPYFFFERFIKSTKREDLAKLKFTNASKIEGDYTIQDYRPQKALSEEEQLFESDLLGATQVEPIEEEGEEQGFEYQDEVNEEFMSEDLDPEFYQGARKRKSPIINAEVAYSRYIEAYDKFIPGNLNNELFNDLQWFANAKGDFEILGKVLGINQSIKVTDFDLYKYFKAITDYTVENFDNPLMTIDQYNKFVTDPRYRQEVLDSYKGTGLNVLKVLHESPHFFKMFTLAVKTDMVKNNFSAKNKLIRDLTTKVGQEVGLDRLNNKQFMTLSRYVDEVMIVNFLKSANISINLQKGDYDEDNSPILSPKSITLDSMEGRQAFVNWFEKNVVNDLKAGRMRDSDGVYSAEPVANIRGNAFIQQLTIDTRKDPILKKNYSFYKLPINMSASLTEDEKVLMDLITGSFATLRNESYGGKNVLDLLYLYNLIVNKNKATGQSFNRLFDSVSEGFDNDSIMSSFVKFESELDWSNALLQDEKHYNIEDLVRKGLVSVLDYIPKNPSASSGSLRYIAVDNWDDQVKENIRTLYRLGDSEYEQVQRGEYTEKVINLHNGDGNLTDMILDNAYKVKLNRLNKFLGNIELKQLDCI